MSLRAAVYDLLNDIESDVYPLFAPQETTDTYVVYSMRSEPIRTQEGICLNQVLLTLDIYASDFDSCVTLAASIYAGMEGKYGSYGSETLMICNWVSESDGYIPDLDKVNITQEYELKFE